MTSERQVYIHVQLPGTLRVVPAALLKIRTLPDGTQVGRFRYGEKYLARLDAVSLDPFELPLGDGVHTITRLKGLSGAVRDAAPDAWGRRVIEHSLEKPSADLHEIDYLLGGPQDAIGYLSFSPDQRPPVTHKPFNKTYQLHDLLDATEAIEEGKRIPQHFLHNIEPGTSMGGARPKATIEDANRLWLAKFPEKRDTLDMQRIESATLALAKHAGIHTAEARLESIGGRSVLMVERFDREYSQAGYLRHGLVSGLTLLRAEESPIQRENWSYLLLADELRRWSIQPRKDLLELFRRMVFNAAITNDDDHPRNHALIRARKGWRLSPAYDLLPTPRTLPQRHLALEVGRYGRAAQAANLVSECGRFGLGELEARAIIDQVVAAVRSWQEVFAAAGLSDLDLEKIASAFLSPWFFEGRD